MSKIKVWDVVWAVMGMGAIVLVIKQILDLIALPSVDWLLVPVVVGLGAFIGVIPYLSEKLVNRQTAGVWLVVFFVGLIAFRLWPGVIAGLGFAVCLLVGAIGYFRSRLLSAKHSSQ